MMGLIMGAANQPAEQVDVDAAAGLGGLRKLSGKEAVHEISASPRVEPGAHIEASAA
jgi:hypothetical protein